MDTKPMEERRHNRLMSEQVQYGVSLMHIAGQQAARRYLNCRGVPVEVIDRVLSLQPRCRRQCWKTYCDIRQKLAALIAC